MKGLDGTTNQKAVAERLVLSSGLETSNNATSITSVEPESSYQCGNHGKAQLLTGTNHSGKTDIKVKMLNTTACGSVSGAKNKRRDSQE